MKILKSPKLRKYVKILLFILISFLVGGYLLILGYSYFFEQDKIAIDRYNFEQLEKAKPTLGKIPQEEKKIFTIGEFNKLENINIEPIKNCYYISNSNGDYTYIFGFKLESLIYKVLYFGENYAYPRYDMPVHYFCGGSKYCRDDMIGGKFRGIISNPCRN